MKTLISNVRVFLLLGAVAIVGNAVTASDALAVVCEGYGHTCHLIGPSGDVVHFKEIEA